MVFTSLNFLLYFPVLAIVYYLVPKQFRLWLLLLASYFFYINIKPVYVLLLLGVTLSTYGLTILIDKATGEKGKQFYMIINIVLILLPLFFFKYFGPLNELLSTLFIKSGIQVSLPAVSYILPIGISFYTFMAIGYTIDVYNEEIKAERNFGVVALFVSFFPLILSGPIERAGNMLPQFKSPKPVDYGQITQGLKWMLWGYFMKLVVADRLGLYIDLVHNNYTSHNGTTLLFASLLYPFQVYGDLGGYSLIAIGTAKVLGYNVIPNFNRPFFATSMSELWNRWHMSLISWLKDYLYTPLSFAFRRYKVWGIILALIFTFLISGLWHGASLTFICWGLLQGVFLSIEALTNKNRTLVEKKFGLTNKAWYLITAMILTFLLFSLTQVFGRAENLDEALFILDKILTSHGMPFLDVTTLAYALAGLGIIFLKDLRDEFGTRLGFPGEFSRALRYSFYYLILYMILLLGVFGDAQFLYFKY